jgi:hypothetical protein
MATLDDLVLYPLQTTTPDLDWLEQEQKKAPTDIRLAHDIGLAHYWLAKSSDDMDVCAEHWQHVIATWSMVLRSEFFWQGWVNERSQAYKQTITIEQQEKAREELEKRLMAELSEFDAQHAPAKPYLKLLYILESKSVVSLRKTQGFQLMGLLGENLYCGPLMLRQLGLHSAVHGFFQEQRYAKREAQVSLHFILSSIQGYTVKQNVQSDLKHQLRLCYSSLGLAWVCMEQGIPQLALDLLAEQHCQNCHPELSKDGNSFAPLERCREDCTRFAEENPAHAQIQQGRDVYVSDATELYIRAHLLWAEQCLGSGDVPVLLPHLRQALKAAQKLEMQESLREQIGQLLLSWVQEPEQEERWDAVVALMKDAGEFDTSGTSRSRLAHAYDQRGVKRCQAGELENGCADLRQAYILTPHVERIKKSLLNALREYEYTARGKKNNSLSAELSEEIKHIEEGKVPDASTTITEEQPPKTSTPVSSPFAPIELPASSLVHEKLFNHSGFLNWEQFAPDGREIIQSACLRAKERKEPVVDLPALLLALYKESKSVREQLKTQGFPPKNLSLLNKQMPEQEEVNSRLDKLTPSQFDFWITVVEILIKAWEKADQEKSKITESHIIYGMNASPRSSRWLKNLGLRIGNE